MWYIVLFEGDYRLSKRILRDMKDNKPVFTSASRSEFIHAKSFKTWEDAEVFRQKNGLLYCHVENTAEIRKYRPPVLRQKVYPYDYDLIDIYNDVSLKIQKANDRSECCEK